jgi:hypothetical protein
MTNRKCAYCDVNSNLTNEHIFPEFISKDVDPITTTRTPRGEKAIAADLTIGDVCATCNNEALSALDSYMCELNEKYSSKIIHPGDKVRFSHDPDKTLRWLLKIGYNVARARKWDDGHWRQVRGYMLGSSPRPKGYRIFLQLLIPSPVSDFVGKFDPGVTEVPPLPMRVTLVHTARMAGIASGFTVSIRSYRFCILRETDGAKRSVVDRTVRRCLAQNRGSIALNFRERATIFSSSVKAFDDVKEDAIFHQQFTLAAQLKSRMKEKRRAPI